MTAKARRFVPSLTALDVVALAFSVLLSLACLVRGAAADSTVACLLLVLVPLLWLGLRSAGKLDASLCIAATGVLIVFVFILALQWLLPPRTVDGLALRDVNALMRSLGHLGLLSVCALLALCVASHAHSARLFLNGLLVAGTLCLCLTFFLTAEPISASRAAIYFRHGFANSNAAATYVGLLLLLAMGQAIRFFRIPRHHWRKFILELFEQMTFRNLFLGSFLLLALLLCTAALMLTGSRGGIAASLLAVLLFWRLILQKLELRRSTRRIVLFCAIVLSGLVLMWAFAQYGQMIEHKFVKDGFSSNTRLDVYAATLPMIAARPLLGSGLGSFASAFAPYRPAHISAEGIIEKAHNTYLEFAAEMGVPALLLVLAALLYAAKLLLHGVRHRHEHYVMPGCGLAVLALGALHSLVDFQLQVPALGATFLSVILACAAQSERHADDPIASGRTKRRVRSGKHHKA